MMIKLTAPTRESDEHGSGYYGAPRGKRTHRGVDYAAYPGSKVHAVTAGTVTKLGYPYEDDLSFRYVQITDGDGDDVRYFYVEPSVEEGDIIDADDIIGTVQDTGKRYPNITPHVHFEVKLGGSYLDPVDYLERL